MAFVVADRVKETTTTVGTGAVALAGAVTGFRTFASGIGNSNTTYYTIASQTANEWEVGFGTLDSTSANLARTTVLASSNSGSLVTFSAGTKDVFVTQSAARTLVQASGGTTTNGVLYYTGSGVATGGSALTFDGTTLTANTLNLTNALGTTYGGTARTVGNYSVYANEIHVGKDGNDTTGDGTLINPVLTITKALTLIGAGRNTVIVHPGSYSESPTVSSANTTIATSELTGANTQISGTLTLSAAARVSGIKLTNLTITGSGNTYISNCTVDTQVVKSGTNYVEIINSELQCVSGVQITGAGIVSIVGNKCWAVAVSNASASVLIKDCYQVITPSVSAGTLQIDGSAIFAASPTSNAVTSSAGTAITLANSFVLNSAGTSVERVSLAGNYSILNLVYDKTNSTFAGTSLNAIDYFQYINADRVNFNGSTSGITGLIASAVAGTTSLTLPAATDTLVGRATTDTLTNKTLVAPALGTPASGNLSNCTNIPVNQATGNLPVANLNSGTSASATTFWRGDGTWGTPAGSGGTVTSVGISAPSIFTVTNSPVTGSGTLTLTYSGTALPTTSGGTGLTSFTSGGVVYASSGSALSTGSALTFDGSTLTLGGVFAATRFGINANPINTTSTSQSFARFQTTGADFYIGTESSTAGGFFPSSTAYAAVFYNAASTPIQFYTAATLRATLDSSGNLGIGTSSPGVKLDVVQTGASSGGALIRAYNATDGVGAGQIQIAKFGSSASYGPYSANTVGVNASGTNLLFGTETNNSVIFYQNNAEQMRLTSTGLGIGLGGGSPATKLDVSYTASAGNIVHIAGANNVNGYIGAHASDNGGLYINSNQANQDLRFRTQNTDRATIDSSGNLGLGVTPSAWSVVVPAFQIGGAGGYIAAQGNAEVLRIGSNNYYGSSAFRYVINGNASRYDQTSGTHSWFTAASGTAGNAISFTQAMTLDASGNLVIGDTNASGMRLRALGYSPELYDPTTYSAKFAYLPKGSQELFDVSLGATAKAGYANLINISVADNTGGDGVYLGAVAQSAGNSAANFVFGRRTGAQTWAESMRLDSSGNLGIGTTSPLSRGHFVAASNSTDDNTLTLGFTFGSDSVKMGSIGTHNADGSNGGLMFSTLASSTLSEKMRLSSTGGLSVGTTADPGAGAIYATGNITAYYSDDRLKNRLGSIESALDKVDQLSGFYYEANETAQQLGYKPKREVGVSAQDVQKVMPEIVSPAPIDPEYLTISYERLVPLLVEAIKELRAEVRALRQ